MPIPATAVTAAQALQRAAAQSAAPQTRLIAGPGTGKSSVIEQRVCWLLDQGVPPAEIYAVSFTRASARDLQARVVSLCQQQGHGALVGQIRVSTLHSLALRILRAAGLLTRFPTDPLVLDDWELENIFDGEFGDHSGIGSKIRREDIRRYHEAYWSTGNYLPANYLPPNPPITQTEAATFLGFHGPRTQSYACVLPGEIVRQCVQEMNAGTIDPVQLMHMRHIIVDEFQDLNPMDLEFVHSLANQGVILFAAGDDDQSIYSFRFANPMGIQDIPGRYPGCGLHQLNDCFRCMPDVLGAANVLITSFPPHNRIPKNSASLYSQCNPPVSGIVLRWRFQTGGVEASGIASSCRALIDAGINPRDILILLSNKRALERELAAQLTGAQVPIDSSLAESFLSTSAGRLVLALLRIVCDGDDYVAHRTLLGERAGVGIRTCNEICAAVIGNGLNFRDIFYHGLPVGVFSTRATRALDAGRMVCALVATWQPTDTLGQRAADLTTVVNAALRPQEAVLWQNYQNGLPADITLHELRDFMWADNDEQQAVILATVFTRLGRPVPEAHVLPQRVRIMTMHGAKGLSAKVVFIPGLEENILPGPWRAPYPGLVLEAARLLYVSITRARAVCILTCARRRFMNGGWHTQVPSRFDSHLGGPFVDRATGFARHEIQAVAVECGLI
jgi:DNA helicase-2/ATP-dependent DNA helicase PcrA